MQCTDDPAGVFFRARPARPAARSFLLSRFSMLRRNFADVLDLYSWPVFAPAYFPSASEPYTLLGPRDRRGYGRKKSTSNSALITPAELTEAVLSAFVVVVAAITTANNSNRVKHKSRCSTTLSTRLILSPEENFISQGDYRPEMDTSLVNTSIAAKSVIPLGIAGGVPLFPWGPVKESETEKAKNRSPGNKSSTDRGPAS